MEMIASNSRRVAEKPVESRAVEQSAFPARDFTLQDLQAAVKRAKRDRSAFIGHHLARFWRSIVGKRRVAGGDAASAPPLQGEGRQPAAPAEAVTPRPARST